MALLLRRMADGDRPHRIVAHETLARVLRPWIQVACGILPMIVPHDAHVGMSKLRLNLPVNCIMLYRHLEQSLHPSGQNTSYRTVHTNGYLLVWETFEQSSGT